MALRANCLLSSEECLKIVRTSILDDSKQISITNIQWNKLEKCTGFMGEYYELRISTASSNIFQYFVKSLPVENVHYREECIRKGVLKKEMSIYTDILPQLQKYALRKLAPNCYYAREDLLVLEDLRLSNYQHLEPGITYTMNHFKPVLSSLASLHAASIAWERFENFSIGERYKEALFELLLSNKNEWYMAGVKAIIHIAAKYCKLQNHAAQDFVDNKLYDILMRSEQLTQPSIKLRNVFCHRDASDGNILMSYAASQLHRDCCLVDYGLATYNFPAVDILFPLYINTLPETRTQQLYEEFTEFYFATLQNNFQLLNIPSSEISKKDFLEECQRARLAALIMSSICVPLMKMPAGLCTQMREENNQKFDYWMNVDRTELLTIAMAKDVGYKKMVLDVIEELIQFIMENEMHIDQ